MEYRILGRTGLRVSAVALGCEGFIHKTPEEVCADFDFAIGHGVNFIDIYSPNPELRTNIGAALEGRRGDFVIQGHLCTTWENGQYLRTRDPEKTLASFDLQLQQLRTDCLDIGMIHYVDAEVDFHRVFGGEIIRIAQRLREEGRIRHIGISDHNPAVARMAVETGLVDVLMFSVNPCYDLQPAGDDVEALWAEESYAGAPRNIDPDRERLYELCERTGVGIDAMKVYGGGDLLNAENSPVREGHDAGAVYRIRPDAAGRGFRDGRMQDAGRNPGRTRLVRRIARRKGLCLRNGRHGAVYLGRALHVLRPLRPLFGGNRHRDGP